MFTDHDCRYSDISRCRYLAAAVSLGSPRKTLLDQCDLIASISAVSRFRAMIDTKIRTFGKAKHKSSKAGLVAKMLQSFLLHMTGQATDQPYVSRISSHQGCLDMFDCLDNAQVKRSHISWYHCQYQCRDECSHDPCEKSTMSNKKLRCVIIGAG